MNFKVILKTKDKKLIQLYEVVYFHLDYIKHLESIELVNNYIKRMYAFQNGYTEKNKLFKDLREVSQNYPHLYLEWLVEYAKYKVKHLPSPIYKKLDDFLDYAKNQSILGYLLLIVDLNAPNHLKIITDFSQMDLLTDLLIDMYQTKSQNILPLPLQLLEDYHIEKSLDGLYQINDRFITLWQLLLLKAKQYSEHVQLSSNNFDLMEQHLIEFIITTRFDELKKIAKELINKIS